MPGDDLHPSPAIGNEPLAFDFKPLIREARHQTRIGDEHCVGIEKIAGHFAARRFVGLDADEADQAVGCLHRSLSEERADLAGVRHRLSQSTQGGVLLGVVGLNAKGAQRIEIDLGAPVSGFELRG